MIRIVIKYLIAILLESKLFDKKEQARLEMQSYFDKEEIMKEIEIYLTNENESTNSTESEFTISQLIDGIAASRINR